MTTYKVKGYGAVLQPQKIAFYFRFGYEYCRCDITFVNVQKNTQLNIIKIAVFLNVHLVEKIAIFSKKELLGTNGLVTRSVLVEIVQLRHQNCKERNLKRINRNSY